MRMHQSDKLLSALQWGAYEAWSAYGAEVPLAVPSETADQVCYIKSRTLLALQTGHCRRLHAGNLLTAAVAAAGDAMLCTISFRAAAV